MRKFKKEISLFLVAAMTMLMLAGCGGNDAAADAGTDNGSQTEGTETEGASSEADTSSDAADSESTGAASGEAQSALPPEALRFTVLLFRTELTLP